MDINWFPGHMAKTRRLIAEQLPLVDLVVEICDARIPRASRNPELNEQISGKPRLLVLSKADLADENKTEQSLAQYKSENIDAIALNLFDYNDIAQLVKKVRDLGAATVEKALSRGRIARALRIMVVGIPNSGKSTLINQLSRRKAAKVEDRPGVTRSVQWIKTTEGFELMDMPGILWPNLGEWSTKLYLAMTGAIKDDILDIVELSYHAANVLIELYPQLMLERFGKDGVFSDELLDGEVDYAVMGESHWPRYEAMARNRACIRKGNRVDEERFAKLLLNEFRNGKIGRISLETAQ